MTKNNGQSNFKIPPEVPESTELARHSLIPPKWREFRVLSDSSAHSWLKYRKDGISDINRLKGKCAGFEKIDRWPKLAKIICDEVKKGDKILIQFDERFVFNRDFELETFMAELKKQLEKLVAEKEVKRIILFTIPANPEKHDDAVYRAQLRRINKHMWDQQNTNLGIFICDIHKELANWFDAKSGLDKKKLVDIPKDYIKSVKAAP